MVKEILTAATFLLAGLCPMMAQDKVDLAISNATAEVGQEVTIPVVMSGRASGFQFQVSAPTGISLSNVLRGEQIKAKNAGDDYVFTCRCAVKEDGSRFILCYSMNELTPAGGEVIRLVFRVDENAAVGDYQIQLKNVECAHQTTVLSSCSEQTAILSVTETTGIEDLDTSAKLTGATSIYALSGERMKQVECDGLTPLSKYLSGLSCGVYIVKNREVKYKVLKK